MSREEEYESLREEIIELAALSEDLGGEVRSLVGGVDNLAIVLSYLSSKNLERHSRDLVKHSENLVKQSSRLTWLTVGLIGISISMIILAMAQAKVWPFWVW